ncbi:MAG: DUF262 domain-containing protein [Alphaproteobacteria bacterium]|nr:DUF262 domain-containing protein [Alphaproteobacteria bacterium]
MEQLRRYESYTIHEAVEKLSKFKFVLPSFQRRMVWEDRQIRDLFDTIINNNLFGSVSAIKQLKSESLFDYYKDFDIYNRRNCSEPSDSRAGIIPPLYYIIDGQQRLTVLHSVLTGSKKLYFDLDKGEFVLPVNINTSCVDVKSIYSALEQGNPESYIKYCELSKYDDNEKKENVFKFYYSFFFNKSIHISLVFPNDSDELSTTKERFINLFVKLNTGGTNLTPADVALCTLKGYYNDFEEIIDNVYLFGKETYYDFPRVFFDSLVLFKNKSKDDNDIHPNAETDYQELYKKIDPIEQYCEPEEKETESKSQKDSSETESDVFNSRITFFYYYTIEEYNNNLLDFLFLSHNVEAIKNVVNKMKIIIEYIFKSEDINSNVAKINKTLLGYVLPIIMARLYYSNDIESSQIISKLNGYKQCNKLMLKDITSIDKIGIDSFYTGGEL